MIGSSSPPRLRLQVALGDRLEASQLLAHDARWQDHELDQAADRPHRFAISANGPLGLRATTRSEFVPENGGTRATLEMELQWPIPVLGRVLEFVILPPRVVRQELARFKAIAERDLQTKPGRR